MSIDINTSNEALISALNNKCDLDGSNAPNLSTDAEVDSKIATVNSKLNNKISITGSRGTLAGYETTGTASTINASSADSNETSAAVTVSNGAANTSWTKIVRLTAASPSVTLSSSWSWVGGSAPELTTGGILICCWCGSAGIANFISNQ